jgi:HAD superfamily hydrolase (TIGR01549 family)
MTYLFDLDNTLIDENEYLFEAYAAIAAKYKFDVNEMIELYLNEGREWLFDKMIGRYGGDKKEYLRILRTVHLEYQLQIYPAMFELLEKINVKGNRIFIVTNGNLAQQINKIRQTDWNGIRKSITFIYANIIYPKPDVRLWYYLKNKYDLREKETVMIGDSEVDKQFSINSNIQFYALNQNGQAILV